jgi:hypothetical protein
MMKRILASGAAVAAIAALSSPAFAAGGGSATLTMTGTVAPACSSVSGNEPVSLTNLTNSDDTLNAAAVNNPSLTASFGGTAWCNGAGAQITLTAQALTTPTVSGAGFTNRIDYVLDSSLVTATLGTVAFHVDTAGVATANHVVGPFAVSSPVSGAISGATAGGNRLVAGTYTGVITVTVSPT